MSQERDVGLTTVLPRRDELTLSPARRLTKCLLKRLESRAAKQNELYSRAGQKSV